MERKQCRASENSHPRGLARLLGLLALIGAATLASPAWSQATPPRGGTLTWIIPQEPAAFVPLTTSAGGSAELGPKVIEGLLAYDRELKPIAQLATGWQVSADGLRYEFTLRQGVKWHDGQPFTAADAAYSIATIKAVHPRGRVTSPTSAPSRRRTTTRWCSNWKSPRPTC